MSKVVIRAVQLEGFSHSVGDVGGQYLSKYDPDAFQGYGEVEWTPNINEAIHFADMSEAFKTWKMESKVRPTRLDGQPNRPLTAFTITFESVKDASSV